jgi:hypothetical protein
MTRADALLALRHDLANISELDLQDDPASCCDVPAMHTTTRLY